MSCSLSELSYGRRPLRAPRVVAQVVALAAANADFLAMIADPEHVDFSKMSMAGKLNVFRKHKYIDVVRPGASRILLEKNESFRKQVIKGHKTPLHYFADVGERQMVRDLAAMWDVPRPLWLRRRASSTTRQGSTTNTSWPP